MRPMNPAPNTRNTDPERIAISLVMVLVGIGFALYLCWNRYHTQIAKGVLAVQYVELRAVALFTHRYDGLLAQFPHAVPEHVSPDTLWSLCTLTGTAMRIPVLALIAVLAITCFLRAPKEQLRQRLDLQGMQRVLARIHPIGKAWLGHDAELVEPAKPDQPLRPLDPALSRAEWLARHVRPDAGTSANDQAAAALARQLGRPWTGFASAEPLVQCLFTVFALQADRRKDDALALLGQLASSLSGRVGRRQRRRKVRLPRLRGARLGRDAHAKAEAIMAGHAYTLPGLMSLLQHARLRTGVFNSGLFSMMQIADRDMWLVLSAVSYPHDRAMPHLMTTTNCVEAAGAIEHWQAECALGGPIQEPRIARTLSSLRPS